MESALKDSLAELEESYTLPTEASNLRESLQGFWKLVITSNEERARWGQTGFGAADHMDVLAQYMCYSEKDGADGLSDTPTVQLVEVVADRSSGRSAVAALKGDFYVGKLASTGELGVVEDYTRIEYDGQPRYGVELNPERFSCVYGDSTFRVIRMEDDHLWLFKKSDSRSAQEEIAALIAAPVAVDASAEAAEAVDSRPLWQIRAEEDDPPDDFNGGEN